MYPWVLGARMAHDLDDVDRGILSLLQGSARHTTAQEMADKVGVSPSTVRNRIDAMEESGVIQGYDPIIDYEAAGLAIHAVLVVSVSAGDRSAAVDRLMGVRGVVAVRELLTASRNLHVEIVARNGDEVGRIADAIHDLDLGIEYSEFLEREERRPFNHFYFTEDAEEEADAGESAEAAESR